MSQPDTIYIVAGNIAEFKYITNKKWVEYNAKWSTGGIPHEMYPNYRYVTNVNTIRGISEIKGFYYGSYNRRTDIEEIRLTIAGIKARTNLTKEKSDLIVYLDGMVLQENRDYHIVKGTYDSILGFTQAPPAGSNLEVIQWKTGMVQVLPTNGKDNRFIIR